MQVRPHSPQLTASTERDREIAAVRQQALDGQYRAHPERFVHGRPQAAMPPSEVTINPIAPEA